MTTPRAPIMEYPGRAKAVIEPSEILSRKARIPNRCVMCYFMEVMKKLIDEGVMTPIGKLDGEGGAVPIYQMGKNGQDIAVCFAGVGAPLAAATLEELIAMGGRMFMVCGGAGVLDGAIPAGHTIIPTWALRDEGTSYHYLQPSRTCRPHKKALDAIHQVCTTEGIDFTAGGTWTTDGVYGETPSAIRRRRAEGCITVEMEAAALFAVARFRKVTLGQVLYAGDDVSGPVWDHRHWSTLAQTREKLFELAVEACKKLED